MWARYRVVGAGTEGKDNGSRRTTDVDMRPAKNTLFILSDEHNRNVAGCYGHPFVQTPNIDALAARGTRFTNAYCNSPICVPSRAALATGRYVHRTRCWDNALAYHGQIPSWHHVVREAGGEAVSIGKLHFRSTDDDNGFSREILPMHIKEGKGDLKALLRANPPPKKGTRDMAAEAGIGTSDYFAFDQRVTEAAVGWIGEAASRTPEAPWALFVSFVMPHFPLVVPERFYALYDHLSLDELRAGLDAPEPGHPALAELRAGLDYDDHFNDEKRAIALKAYFGMVTAVDENIGRVLAALSDAGLADDTRIIYTSDHGDNLGSRGLWGKSVHYEDSAAVPLVTVGEGFPVGVESTPVSLVDIFPTIVESTGAGDPATVDGLDGTSLFDIVNQPDPERAVLSEYHAVASRSGHFMLRKGRWKLMYYVGHPPQLFDLQDDPSEHHDLAADPTHAETLASLEAELRRIVDPEAASEMAFRDQAAVIRAHGGEEAILGAAEIPFTPVPTG